MTLLINSKNMKEENVHILKKEVLYIENKIGRKPKLVIINASNDRSNQSYINNKVKLAEEIGIDAEVIKLEEDIKQDLLEAIVTRLMCDNTVDAVILQLPIFKHLDKDKLISLISPAKDADCFSDNRLGQLIQGKGTIYPCTPKGVIDLLKYHNVKIEGKNITIIGRSVHVGTSLAIILTKLGGIVKVTHSKTKSLESDLKDVDIVVSCVGKYDLIKPEYMKEGSVLIGVGIDFNGKQQTDYDVDKMLRDGKCSMVGDRLATSGLATVISLLENTIQLCKERHKIKYLE